jgi:gliding motility-associated protein GldL
MINLTDVVQSSGWKNFMAKLYGWGASVVIVGAMFKINHWAGGSIVITLGLTTEAIIFFFSAFEPLHEELDWTLVYPELAGISDPDEIENFKEGRLAETTGGRSIERIEDVMGSSAGLDDETISKLGEGFQKLNQTARSLSDLGQATVATKDFLSNMQNASTSLSTLNEVYVASTDSFKESATNLSNAYFQSADKIVRSGDEIADAYKAIALTIQNENNNISLGNKEHDVQMEQLNNNLKQLNTVYEEQIRESSYQMKGSAELYSGLQTMIQNLKASVEETNKYKEEMSKLKESISSLNSIYGNMLSTVDALTK